VNVTFGLVAAWLAFCLGVVGVKGKGLDLSATGSDQFDPEARSLGATLVELLRGQWPYTPSSKLDSQGNPIGPAGPGGTPTLPIGPGGRGVFPAPTPGHPGGFGIEPPAGQAPAGLEAPPQAGSVNL
jgi:hypothetical protein